MPDYLLAIDQGTTSTRAILFDVALTPVASAQQEFTQIYPAPGLVEHDPEDIWSTTLATVRAAIARAGADASDIRRAIVSLGEVSPGTARLADAHAEGAWFLTNF